jgi:hypothetical protein
MNASAPTTHSAGTPHTTFRVGDSFAHAGVNVTVLRGGEPFQDRFGRTLTGYWCRRNDTGAEGYVPFGPGGVVSFA